MVHLSFFVALAIQPPQALPDIMQHSRSERDHTTLCGPLSLARLMTLSGESIEFDSLLPLFQNRTDEGVQLREMVAVAKSCGFPVQAVRVPSGNLSDVRIPSIVLVDNDMHCLVLEAIDEGAVTVWDPSSMTSMNLPIQVMEDKWNGKAIVMAQTDQSGLSVGIGIALICVGFGLLLRQFFFTKQATSDSNV